jgi:hypothetical protein
MAEAHVCGGILPQKMYEIRMPGNAISCILSIQIWSKINANYICIWNKRRKKRTKNNKLLTIIYHYLVVKKRNNLNRFC